MNLREKCAQMVVGAYWFNDQEYEGAIELAKAGAGGLSSSVARSIMWR
jgi:hypothetical protein